MPGRCVVLEIISAVPAADVQAIDSFQKLLLESWANNAMSLEQLRRFISTRMECITQYILIV